ncbi:MAG: MFS transporter [Acidobacteria bacterium]|nr:MAG: MFS transporter [Acidobacteriota bacterium]
MDVNRRSRVRWRLLAWIFVLSAITFLDRVNISISGVRVAEEYHFSNVQLGLLLSSFLWGYAIFQVPGGKLADRFGPRRVLTGGALWWGVFTALTAAIPVETSSAVLVSRPSLALTAALALFLGGRFVLGAGEAVMFPSSNRFVANWIPSAERGTANGVIFAGVGAGACVTPPLITALMIHYGWRVSFWVCAVIGCLAGLVWFLLAKDTPEEHSGVTASELALIVAGRTASGSSSGNAPSWSSILKSKEVLASTFSYFCYGYAAWIFFSWFFIYLVKVRGVNLKLSSFYTTLPFLAMALGSPLGGAISDAVTRRRGKRLGRCGIAVFGMGLAALLITAGSSVKGTGLASVVLASGVGALYLAQSSFWALTADIAGPSAGSVSGLMNAGGQAGGAVTAFLTPAIAARFGWAASFLVAAALCTLGAAAWLLVDPGRVLVHEIHAPPPG